MLKLILIFIGGGLGSLSRYGISKIFDYRVFDFPLSTLISNTLACLILGMLLGIELKSGITNSTKLLIITGFCGGFSTFSTFSAESLKLFTEGNYGMAIINIFGSIIICFICVFVGIKLSS